MTSVETFKPAVKKIFVVVKNKVIMLQKYIFNYQFSLENSDKTSKSTIELKL